MDTQEFAKRMMLAVAQQTDDETFAALYSPEGLAPTCDWMCEDGWLVSYTTKRIRAGTLDGLFAAFIYEPRGSGSRSGKAKRWERVRTVRCDTRQEAKEWALRHYYEHSPKRAAKHGWTGDGYASEREEE